MRHLKRAQLFQARCQIEMVDAEFQEEHGAGWVALPASTKHRLDDERMGKIRALTRQIHRIGAEMHNDAAIAKLADLLKGMR